MSDSIVFDVSSSKRSKVDPSDALLDKSLGIYFFNFNYNKKKDQSLIYFIFRCDHI